MPDLMTPPTPASIGKLDYYWATADAETCVKQIVARRDSWYQHVAGTEYYYRVERNWRYYHGIYHARGLSEQGKEVQRTGVNRDRSKINPNHFRSFIHLLLTYTIQNRPAWDTRAINADNASLLQAELGNQILDYYMEEKKVEKIMRNAVESALVFSVCYIHCYWNEEGGKEIGADSDTMDIYYEGDLDFSNLNLYDVVYDLTQPSFDESRWCAIRRVRNKWELIAKHMDKRDEIIRASTTEGFEPNRFWSSLLNSGENDNVVEWVFYHDRTPAHPMGRMLTFVGDKTVLTDGPLPDAYRRKPVYRLSPADFLLTSFGYTPGFDLQGPQEALNMIASTILTNQNNLGPTKIWFKSQEVINRAQLEPGINAIQTETPPQPLNLCQTAPEFFKSHDMWIQAMEYLSGINSVARGQPEASLKSGAALALIDAKAVQYASLLIQAYYDLLSQIGTAILFALRSNVFNERFIAISGQNMQSQLKSFGADDLRMIDRVVVQSANPLMRITAGRKEIASDLLQNGLIQTPEEYLTVIQTGQLKPLTESVDAQLRKIHAENESLRSGGPHAAMATDNHVLHIKKHQSILDSPDTYGNPQLAESVTAAILEHIQHLQNPQVQMLQVALGYPTPFAPQPMMPQGKGPPANGSQGKPKQERKQVPGAPDIPGYPNGGDQSLRGTAA